MKSKPIGVRFDLDFLRILKETRGIETPQQALNYLTSLWVGNQLWGKDGTKPIYESHNPKTSKTTKATQAPPPVTVSIPPAGLSRTDLMKWQRNNKT